jgi:hypothetical protein
MLMVTESFKINASLTLYSMKLKKLHTRAFNLPIFQYPSKIKRNVNSKFFLYLGLHDISPMVSNLWVIRSVLQPILAEAAAASVPIREEI